MGRKKKAPENPPAAPIEAAPNPEAVAAPVNGQMALPAPATHAAGEPELNMDALRADAEDWALESGLKRPFTVSSPERKDYPERGHGYIVTIHENKPPKPNSNPRMGTARFDAAGRRTMWTIDGTYAG